jgi:hypothetical protein
MIWRDIAIDRKVTRVELLSALMNIFKSKKEDISMVNELEDSEQKPLICVLTEMTGDFCLMLSFYLNSIPVDEFSLITSFCKELNCKALISNDDSNNPYSMILADAEGTLDEVELDPEKLDDYEEYKVLKIKTA